jgi:predicted dehydrogenase
MKPRQPIRIAVLGLTHDHVWYNLRELKSLRDATLVAAADPNQPLRDRVAREFKCATYAGCEELLDRERVDAVYLYGDNATGAELTRRAAARGLHVMVEKPMAASLAGADGMLAAARNADVRLMVAWPFTWWPPLQAALAMAQRGDLGRVWQVKYRAAHAGPREMGCSKYFSDWLYNPDLNGAGALVDYCCYGALLARLLMGVPARVTATAGRFVKEDILVDDNAVILMTYAHGLAVAEASWTQVGHLSSYVVWIYGTTGTLMVEPGERGRLLLATAKQPDGAPVRVPRPPAHLRNASAQFVHCLRTGHEFHPLGNDRICRDAQEILQAGQLSVRQGSAVALPLPAG